jgi:hypothetical protein
LGFSSLSVPGCACGHGSLLNTTVQIEPDFCILWKWREIESGFKAFGFNATKLAVPMRGMDGPVALDS